VNQTISAVSIYSHENDLGDKVWNPAIRWKIKYAVFVVIEDNTGLQGLGECWCFDAAPDSLVAFLRTEVIPHFLGCSIANANNILEKQLARATLTARHGILCSALSGIDIALNDLQAKQVGVPLCEWLGASFPANVPVYASGGLYGESKEPDDLALEMRGMADAGFDLVKMKIGGMTIEEDAQRIISVLDALPSQTDLIIDGVYSYSIDSCLDIFEKIPSERIVAFQSPLPASDIQGMAQLNNAGIPVMATEAEYRLEIHQQLVDQNAVTYLQTAPIACGGLKRLKELDRLISRTPIRLSLEVSSTAVAFLTACHFAVAFNSVAHVELHYLHQVFFDQLLTVTNKTNVGIYSLGHQHGLGIELDLACVKLEYTSSI